MKYLYMGYLLAPTQKYITTGGDASPQTNHFEWSVITLEEVANHLREMWKSEVERRVDLA